MAEQNKPVVVVRASPPNGYRWRVVLDGETIGSGSAASEFEARNAANEIVARLQTKPFGGP